RGRRMTGKPVKTSRKQQTEAPAAAASAAQSRSSPSRASVPQAHKSPPAQQIAQEALLAALPHPMFVVGRSNRFIFANAAAESFFSTSEAILRRISLDELVGFGCPLLALAEQVRSSGATLNEYEVEIVTPRFSGPKLVDVYGG